MQPHDINLPQSVSDVSPDEPISLAHVVGVLRRYRIAIIASLLVILVAYLLVAVASYVLVPSKQVTTLPFRVVFEGAEAGRYPNGLQFNNTEITATPVLQKVYADHKLQRFTRFSDFKSAIFVTEQNRELDRLALEYNSRLADPRLSPLDRERIEKEYDLRKDSIRRTDYALNFVVDDGSASVPRALRTDVLKSVLDTWAEQAMNEKGAGRYRIPVLSRNILQGATGLEDQDYIVAIDVLRTKTNRLIAMIDQMLRIPGAEVLASGKEKVTLPEIRVNLEDTRRFRLEPMIAIIRMRHLSRNPQMSMDFLQSQLESARRRRDQERARVDQMQRSLDLYMQRASSPLAETAAERNGANAGRTQVTPLVDKSFLDQLSDLVAQKRDVDYRQRLVDNLNAAAINELLPAESEVSYYETCVQSMKAPAAGGGGAGESTETVQREYQRALDEIYRSVDQVSDIYSMMSRNLNPGLVVYTLTDPVQMSVARSSSPTRLLAFGVLIFVIAVPLVLFGALLHNRISEEEKVEQARHGVLVADS